MRGPRRASRCVFLRERRTDPEAELAIVIGKAGTDISRERALDYVFGYSIGLDTSLRGMEPPSQRKSIDTYATLGPWIVTKDEVPDPDHVSSRLFINDTLAQEADTDNFAFDVRTIVRNISSSYTLYPGDVIMAGTPPQFQRIAPGDRIRVEFENVGDMSIIESGLRQRLVQSVPRRCHPPSAARMDAHRAFAN